MEENLEIYFCEICSESITADDVSNGTAVEVEGKVIGPCCLPAVQRPSAARASSSPAGFTALGAVVLAAIAGATVHLEWRLSEEVALLKSKVEEVEANVSSSGTQTLADLEKSLDGTIRTGELKPITDELSQLAKKVSSIAIDQSQLTAAMNTTSSRLGGLDESQRMIVSGQTSLKSEIKEVALEIMRLERDIASAAAAPRGSVADASVVEPKRDPVAEKKAVAGSGLPAALGREVTRLKDGDAGNRFEAVDQLVQSKNKLALPHLIPMLKDPDAFVRRLSEATQSLPVGPPEDPTFRLGPVIDEEAQERVTNFLRNVGDGARLAARSEARDDGFYVPASVFTGSRATSSSACLSFSRVA